MRLVLLAAALFLLAACGSPRVGFDQSKLSQFQIGQTTEEQVLAALGPPFHSFSNTAAHLDMLTYVNSITYFGPSAFAEGFLLGSQPVQHNAVTFQFDASTRRLVNVISSTANTAERL